MSAYLFAPSECPNQGHPFSHRCKLCGHRAQPDQAQGDGTPPESFNDWLEVDDVAWQLQSIDAPADVLRHAWHQAENIYAADCLHCNPRHVDVSA